ncbi:N-(5'-phosphoribosyl)anthranilate isomerase [Legionella fallonii LLAP-10]|uniref:N-(5'-phosphoribosyl)anthranilate isomerase n=2 Tax=Legionella fallonii TaxID=96230 RepID=A0A098G3W9_9GAMM|nr:N-(5'-phosphoribosyl)anthranilate isomerase [Legionella fallonii LLAP-10]
MCGMTRAEDVAHAISLGVDAIGLIFYPKSPRNVTIETARPLLDNIPPFVSAVAVLVNPEMKLVEQILKKLPIQLLQFHGDESPEFCQQFGKPFIKAIQPQTADQIKQEMERYSKASALLLDTPSVTNRGGTGLTFDWNIIPPDLPKPYILAGGLNQFNVLDAIKMNPYAVDVSSGVESEPGIKDHLKMSQFIKVLWGIQ